jgi:hypothetical protein
MSTEKYEAMSLDELTEYCTQEYKELSIRGKQLDVVKKILFKKMADTNTEEVTPPFGRFIQYFRTTYTYPEDVIALKNTLAEAEERAKAEGRVEEKKIPTYKFADLKKEDKEF